MRIELGNRLEEVSTVVTALESFCKSACLDKAVTQAAELALDELLTNIISYGYPDSEQHEILVEMSIVPDALKLVVSDDGAPFNPFEHKMAPSGLSIEERQMGGVGIHLVKELMDDYAYQRLQERNVVTLHKFLGRVQED